MGNNSSYSPYSLLEIVGRYILLHPEPKNIGQNQWRGPHFLVVLRRAKGQVSGLRCLISKLSRGEFWSEEYQKYNEMYPVLMRSSFLSYDRGTKEIRKIPETYLPFMHSEELSHGEFFWKQECQKVLDIILPFILEAEEFLFLFAVPKQGSRLICQKYCCRNDDAASLIRFLVDALSEICKHECDVMVLVPAEIDVLLQKLKFLLAIFWDAPFRCCDNDEVGGGDDEGGGGGGEGDDEEEESKKNNIIISEEIRSIANEAGSFFRSFFFTTNPVTMTEMDEALSALLQNFDKLEAKIKEHCITHTVEEYGIPVKEHPIPVREHHIPVSMRRYLTSRFSRLVRDDFFYIDQVLGLLNHLINKREFADFIVDVKDQITTLHDELNFSRSFLKHIDQVRQHSKELFVCAVQLRYKVAGQAYRIIHRFATGGVPVWYISLRLSYFIHKCTEIGAAFHEIYPDSAFKYLSLTLSERILVHPESKFGNKTQWHGQHFLVVVRYAIKISEHGRFGDRKKRIEDLRSLSVLLHLKRSTGFWKQESQKALDIILPFIPEVSEDLFTVPRWQQDSKNKITASFIRFLVDALSEICKRESDYLILVPAQIDILLKNLQFLVAILGDTPFQCSYSEVVEEESNNNNNILVEIESFANEAGIFFHSFFFTTDLITVKRMDEELSVLLLKFEEVEAKIKEEVEAKITVLQLENMASSVSIFLVDSVLNDLNHLTNHKEADSIVDVKNKMMKLYEDIVDSRSSFLKDRKVQQNNKEFIECAMKLRDLAYEADYIITCFVIGEVPVWYLSLRLSNFIQRSQQNSTAFHKIKANSGIIGTAAEDSSEVSPQVPRSIPIDDEIVGFEEITRQIEQQLRNGQNCLQVISIIGMSGIGKTTLAKRLYNKQSIVSRFDLRLWCVVSQTYRWRQLLIQILSCIPELKKDEISKMEDSALVEHLYRSVRGKRYLLVVDDLWNKEAWNDLRRIFQDEQNRSRIIFTSQDKDVVPLSDEFLHEIPLLSADVCWDLLKKKVFKEGPCPPELEDVGKEIATKCMGLPLVVVLIAGVLVNMPREVIKWREVRISSYMSDIHEKVELSYKHLPLHLQPCFLYFSRFEEDKEIRVRELLPLWISLGYIEKTEDKNLEDVAEDYLKELINRSMVQVSKRRWDNGIETLNIHDLIRRMCMRIAEENNFLKVIQGEFSIYEQHHHMCLDRFPLYHNSTMDGLHIYSLCCCPVSVRITSSLKLVRVLESLVVPTNFAPELLVKLRYLDIQDFGKNKIWMLENLEFLFVRGDFFEDVALILKNMPKLKHLYLENGAVLSEDGNISEPNSLETLSYIFILDLNDEECLKHFHHLRHLKCKYGEIESPNLGCLSLLESLEIGTCAYMPRLQKINFPISIRKLSLYGIQLPYEIMSVIGRLPNLEIFKVRLFYVEERSWKTNDDEFKKLKFLELDDFEVEQWKISRDHFPKLERLVVRGCRSLQVLPSELGFIPKLRKIELCNYNPSIKYSARKIQKEQHENGNYELKVIINGTAYDFVSSSSSSSEEEFDSGSE